MRPDVVVVGAGPAGLRAAADVAGSVEVAARFAAGGAG